MVTYLLKKSYQLRNFREIEFKDLWGDHGVFTTMWIYGSPTKILFFKDHINNLIKSTKSYGIFKKPLKSKILNYVQEINKIIPSRGIVRYDFLKTGEEVYINEINTIPGSHALYLWKNLNVSKYELLNDIVQEAINDKSSQWSTQGSDGLALKSAKDIQSKLG